jgi:hypothetical protein
MPAQCILAKRPSLKRQRHCFPLARRIDVAVVVPRPLRLATSVVDALARLLPLLGCGEEAASLAFDGLARSHSDDAAASDALQSIAKEELVHDALLRSLSNSLPPSRGTAEMLAVARRFHVDLGLGDATDHLARITALDSAVCTILARLIGPGKPLAQEGAIVAILHRIGRDEARHVKVSRRLALDRRGSRALREIAAPTRAALSKLLALASDDFEALAVDPDRLRLDLSCLPDGLFGT